MWTNRLVMAAAGATRIAARVVNRLSERFYELICMIELIASAKKFITSEDAPTMVEYGLLVGLIAVVVAAAAAVLGVNVSTLFTAVGGSV